MISDIVKILFSKDFRESFKELYLLTKNSKRWKNDIKINKGDFNDNNREEASLLLSDSIHYLRERNWEESDLINARFVYWELFENALEHGTRKDIDNNYLFKNILEIRSM